jgi:hypothetical protein
MQLSSLLPTGGNFGRETQWKWGHMSKNKASRFRVILPLGKQLGNRINIPTDVKSKNKICLLSDINFFIVSFKTAAELFRKTLAEKH